MSCSDDVARLLQLVQPLMSDDPGATGDSDAARPGLAALNAACQTIFESHRAGLLVMNHARQTRSTRRLPQNLAMYRGLSIALALTKRMASAVS